MEENGQYFERLRHIQINLKRENTFYTFFRTETRELNHKIKYLYLSTLYQHKKLGMIHMEAMLNKDITSRPLYVSSFYAQDPTRIPKANQQIDEKLYSQIQNEISKLTKDISHLCKCCQKIYKTKNEILIHILALSTLPSIFRNLLFKESVDKFLVFMKLMIKDHYHHATILALALYIHPLFVDFLQEAMSDLDINSEKYFHNFQKNWKKNAKYCPLPIIEMISYAEDPADFLCKSLFECIARSLRSMNAIPLVPNMEIPPYDKIIRGFKKISPNLWAQLNEEKNNATLLPSSQDIQQFIPDFGEAFLLSPFDIDVILTNHSSHESNRHFQSYCFTAFLFMMPKLQSYCYSDPILMQDLIFPDNVEGKLREILIKLDNVFIYSSLDFKTEKPLISPLCLNTNFSINKKTSDTNKKKEIQLYKFLDDQISFMPSKEILKLKLNALSPYLEEEVKKIKDTEKNEVDIFNDILENGFNERETEREFCFSDIALMNQVIFSLENISNQILEDIKGQKNVITFYLIEKWSHTFTQSNNISPEDWNKLYTDDQSFLEFFQKCFDDCKSWCQNNKYTLSKGDIIKCLFNNVMLFFSFKKFLGLSEDLVRKDTENSQKIDKILKDGTIDFIPMAEKLIGENVQKKVKPILKMLKSVDNTDQPLVKIENFLQAESMLFNLLQFVGVSEIGADQIEPCLFLLFSMANLPHLESTVQYINHFTSPLRSFGSFPLGLPFERFKSSIIGFLQLIDERSVKSSEKE